MAEVDPYEQEDRYETIEMTLADIEKSLRQIAVALAQLRLDAQAAMRKWAGVQYTSGPENTGYHNEELAKNYGDFDLPKGWEGTD